MFEFDDATLEKLFGAEDAENENPQRLRQYFVRNKAFESLTADLPIRILVGHKGVGKSALLKMAYLNDIEHKNMALWVQPDDVKHLLNHKNDNLNSLIDAWKRGLVDLIFRKTVEKIGQTEDEQSYGPTRYTLQALFDSVRNYLTTQTNKVVDATAQAFVAAYLKNEVLRIYIDDLDRGWQAKPEDIKNISALLNAVRDLCGSDKRLQIRLGLRSDVYFLVRTADESTDKIERNFIWLTWNNHEILAVMAKRIATYFGKAIDEFSLANQRQAQIAKHLYPVIEERFNAVGKWQNAPIHRVLLSLTRRRPRDLVKLFYGSAKEAHRNGRAKITTADLSATFAQYSNERMQDIINEFKSELPTIGELVHGMRPTTKERTTLESYMYSNDKLFVKLRDLMSSHHFQFTNGASATAKSLAEFLYKIDFIPARKDEQAGRIVRIYFDQNRYLQSQFADYGFHWEVHPAYRWALQPGDMESIFNTLLLSTE
jgi:hypothetical protein